MKKFTRIEPTTVQKFGLKYPRYAVVKNFQTDDGKIHEFTTFGKEDARSGAVIAITPDGQVVTTYEFRAGPERYMYELPGGVLDGGEDPQVGALRELAEETGYSSDDVQFLGKICRDGYVNDIEYYYLALNCTQAQTQHHQDTEEVEQGAEVRLISIEQLFRNAITDSMTYPAAVLMAYDKLKELQQNV